MPIPEKLIKAVHDDHHKENNTPYKWAEIEISHGSVYLHVGRLRPDGTKETRLVSRKYHVDSEGNVRFTNIGGDGSGI